jgi:hypothetical protein
MTTIFAGAFALAKLQLRNFSNDPPGTWEAPPMGAGSNHNYRIVLAGMIRLVALRTLAEAGVNLYERHLTTLLDDRGSPPKNA